MLTLLLTFFILMMTKCDFDWKAKCSAVQVKKKCCQYTLCAVPPKSVIAVIDTHTHLFIAASTAVACGDTQCVYVTHGGVRAWMGGSQKVKLQRAARVRSRCANVAALK